ncbi:MAG: hypothetical protein ABFD10_13345 [Prolixibacteraceae bacterium]
MEPEVIKYILQKYFDGESSLEDERILHNYFRSEQIDEGFRPYRDLFTGLSCIKDHEIKIREEDLMDLISENKHQEKTRYRQLWQIVTGVAATLLVTLSVVYYTNDKPDWKDTYTDPDQAYATAVQTLHFVAGKYREGLAQLKPVAKLNQAVEPMSKSLDLLNKEFYKIENLQKLNTKLTKEKP